MVNPTLYLQFIDEFIWPYPILSCFLQDCTAMYPLMEGQATPKDIEGPLIVERTGAGSFSRPKMPIQVKS